MIGRRISLVAALSLMLIALGCKPKESVDDGAEKATTTNASKSKKKRRGRQLPEQVPDPGDPVGDAHDEDKNKELPFVEAGDYETLMLALAGCPLEGMTISNGCPAARNLAKVRRESRLSGDISPALGVKHINHPQEAVRVHAASLLRAVLGSSKTDVAAVAIAAAAKEKSAAVLAQLVRVLAPLQQTRRDVGPVLETLATSKSALVRGEVAEAFSSDYAAGVDGTLEALIAMVEKDRDDDVRARACRALGERIDDRALPTLARLTDKSVQARSPDLYVACWRGLVRMSVGRPGVDHTSEAAFDQFVATLAKTTCSAKTPPWEIFNPLGELASSRRQPPPWLAAKLPALHEQLVRVASCKDAHWIARAASVDALKRSGAPAATLAGLKAAMKKAAKAKTGGDVNAAKMVQKIEAVEKMKN